MLLYRYIVIALATLVDIGDILIAK